MIRRLFRPSYGRYVKVTPRRWWSLRDRKVARLGAVIADYEWEREVREITRRLVLGDR